MKKNLLSLIMLCCMVIAKAQTQPNNEIWYTTTDGEIFELNNEDIGLGIYIVSNSYDKKKNCFVIRFSQSVLNIETAFSPRYNKYYSNSLTSVSIPASVKVIATSAFAGNNKLTTLTLAAGSQLETIGGYAFEFANLTGELTLPASVTRIGDDAFRDCELSKVYMSSEDLSEISTRAFNGKTVLHVPAYLYETYVSHFSGHNTVEEPSLDEWKQLAKDEIQAAFDKLTYITPDDPSALEIKFGNIDYAQNRDELNQISDEIMVWIRERKEFDEQVKSMLGTMGTKQDGPALIVTGKDGNKIILYSPKSVEYIKVKEEE